MTDPYETLGVEPDASADEIKKAHRRAAQRSHPDREGGDTKQFQVVTAAYQLLKDPDRRAKYDETGETGDTVGDPATDRLAQLFNMIVESEEFDCNIIDKCKSHIASAVQQLKLELEKTEVKLVRLESQVGRIDTDGHNLFENILNAKIESLTKKITHCNAEVEILTKMKRTVGDYIDTSPPSSPTGTVWGSNTSTGHYDTRV